MGPPGCEAYWTSHQSCSSVLSVPQLSSCQLSVLRCQLPVLWPAVLLLVGLECTIYLPRARSPGFWLPLWVPKPTPKIHLKNDSKSTGPGIPKGGPTSSQNGAKIIKKCATSVTQNVPSTPDPKNLSFYIPGSLKTALPPWQESYFHNLQGCQKTSKMKPHMTLKFN